MFLVDLRNILLGNERQDKGQGHSQEVGPLWKKATGELIAVKEMETTHILNCINMLENRITEYQDRTNLARKQLVDNTNYFTRHYAERYLDRCEQVEKAFGSWCNAWLDIFHEEIKIRNGVQTIDGEVVRPLLHKP